MGYLAHFIFKKSIDFIPIKLYNIISKIIGGNKMNRNEKYQFLRSMGLSSELSRKWRDRKIEQVETMDINTILKNNPELRRDYNNYMSRLRYNFLRGMGLKAERARTLRRHKKIDVTG